MAENKANFLVRLTEVLPPSWRQLQASSLRSPETEPVLDCHPAPRPKYCGMKLTKNIGMLLLAIYLILDSLLGFGLNLGPFVFLLYLVALAAGIFILIGK